MLFTTRSPTVSQLNLSQYDISGEFDAKMIGMKGESSSQDLGVTKMEIGGNGDSVKTKLKDTTAEKMLEAFTLFLEQQKYNERREQLVLEALHVVVEKLDQFDGRDVSKYLRVYKKEMELNRVPEKVMIDMFELAVVPEIRGRMKTLISVNNDSWEKFSNTLK